MIKGIVLVLAACFVWGLIFIIPSLMVGFSPLEIALGRYFFFGIISCLFMLIKGLQKWQKFSPSVRKQACLYALIVNILYYLCLVTGLQCTNPSVIALIIGLSPITIAFYGNRQNKICSNKQLLLPCLFIAIGLVCINAPAFSSFSSQSLWEYGFGLLCGFFSLLAWNWYMIANAKFLNEISTFRRATGLL